MNITLTPELEDLVNEKIKSGKYNSPNEVVREGLRLLNEQDQLKQLRLEELRREIQKGIDDIREGRYTTYEVDDLPKLAEEIKRSGRKESNKRQERG